MINCNLTGMKSSPKGLFHRIAFLEYNAEKKNSVAFYIPQVSLDYCSSGINSGHEKRASINPQTNHYFEFTLESYRRQGGSFSCTGNELFSVRAVISPVIMVGCQ